MGIHRSEEVYVVFRQRKPLLAILVTSGNCETALNDSRRQGMTLAARRRTWQLKQVHPLEHLHLAVAALLNEKAYLLQNLFAHLDVAQLGGMGKLQLFPKPIQDGCIEVGPFV